MTDAVCVEEPVRYTYGYCQDPLCHSRRAVLRNKSKWMWRGQQLCTTCLKRQQRRVEAPGA